jgi:hypothetical protein
MKRSGSGRRRMRCIGGGVVKEAGSYAGGGVVVA